MPATGPSPRMIRPSIIESTVPATRDDAGKTELKSKPLQLTPRPAESTAPEVGRGAKCEGPRSALDAL
jgi:hypothetical protein